jgi:hypothetical protein
VRRVTEARLLRLLSAEAEAALVRLIDERVAQKLAENDGGQPAPTPFLTVKEAAVFPPHLARRNPQAHRTRSAQAPPPGGVANPPPPRRTGATTGPRGSAVL